MFFCFKKHRIFFYICYKKNIVDIYLNLKGLINTCHSIVFDKINDKNQYILIYLNNIWKKILSKNNLLDYNKGQKKLSSAVAESKSTIPKM